MDIFEQLCQRDWFLTSYKYNSPPLQEQTARVELLHNMRYPFHK
jgi:hypothetical protein